ncbi:restriction endonuclease [Streptomyces sp. NPDC085466]|uniref:restriction endonuclease n=1 Tax=Streptomyces sp. NPDC085466 TaxID=3365725 RepID=UPI0037D2BD4C
MAARRQQGMTFGQQVFLLVLAFTAYGLIYLGVREAWRWSLAHPWLASGLAAGVIWLIGFRIRKWRARRARQVESAALVAKIQAAQSMEIARYHVMSPSDFEDAIAFLCERDGCTDVKVVGGAGDLGADVVALTPDGRRLVIQCKRYRDSNKVGSQDLQRFGGTCFTVHRADVAVMVTTSTFTKPASGYAKQTGICLIDAYGLAGWASKLGSPPWVETPHLA